MSFPVTDGVETAVAPPDGWVVDFEHPTTATSIANSAYFITAFELAIATVFLAQRLYTKYFLIRKIQIDDYMITMAWVGAIGAQAILIHAYRAGLLGVHAWEMSLDRYNESSKMVLATTLTYVPTTILSKLTMCVFYFRLSPVRMYQYSVYVTAFICAGSLVGIWFSVLFSCRPISASWDVKVLSTAKCINTPVLYIIQAAFGCITDVMLLVIPIPTIVKVQMSRRYKIGLLGMFAIGSITLITSIIRLVLLIPGLSNADQPWALAEGCLWVNVEANLLIMCGSLPTLRTFLGHVCPRLLGDKSARDSSGKDTSDRNYGLRTFGQGRKKTPRRGFDSLMDLEREDGFRCSRLRPDEGKNDVDIRGGRYERGASSREDRVKGDTDSEEAILQTRTTIVSFSRR
ncbi:hypothetical protein F5Y15DRAFT_145931 [Xylariaceae sp. FL0016]|nr:hypothetical protein F5Y15DRAFT_145931 [Xylariaceae sp. FL0016]